MPFAVSTGWWTQSLYQFRAAVKEFLGFGNAALTSKQRVHIFNGPLHVLARALIKLTPLSCRWHFFFRTPYVLGEPGVVSLLLVFGGCSVLCLNSPWSDQTTPVYRRY